jgi:cytochrome c553
MCPTRVAIILGMFLLALSAPASAAGDAAAGKTKMGACSGCHGADGNSLAATTPKLAGQMPEYLVKQMRDFAAGRRVNCKGFAGDGAARSDADIADLAAYFMAQPITPDAADATRLAVGEQIYSKGRKTPRFVPACVGCHGLQGAGKRDWNMIMSSPPAVLPSSIGGQHPAYVAEEIRAFHDGRRSNDMAAVMRKLAVNLTDDEIDAVAAYVGTMVRR